MPSEKFLRKQLENLKSTADSCSLSEARKAQDLLGKMLAYTKHNKYTEKEIDFPLFKSALVTPKEQKLDGVMLYLHGGGYTCGNLGYAAGVAAYLASECGVKVFCPAYRLAPEYRFPAALDDALTAYNYLLESGYTPEKIILCGESAGGGLIYSLCLKLKTLGFELPKALIAISPWTDLTQSGKTYEINRDIDPSMSKERLDRFADMYTSDKTNPLVSPVFGSLDSFPPSLVFSGGSEVMLDDAVMLVKKLTDCGCKCEHIIAPNMWHAYLIYCMKEHYGDFEKLKSFVGDNLPPYIKCDWLKLDNAAKIYPAARRRNWTNLFRLSLSFDDEIDRDILKSALEATVKRFPSIAVKLGRGMFWYYLEPIGEAPEISDETYYPTAKMSGKDLKKCAFRVIAYKNRIAVEFFHALTDGTGGLVFLKSLAAEYTEQRYGIKVPFEKGVLDRRKEPSSGELEDSFLKYAGDVAASRKEATPYHLSGTPEKDGFIDLTCFVADYSSVKNACDKYGVTVTVLTAAAMLRAIEQIQAEKIKKPSKRKPVKVLIPVNLRRVFESETLRNFAQYVTPEINPRMGEYTFEEICAVVKNQMAVDITPKKLSAKFTSNVRSEQVFILKIMPLFIKNLAMRIVYDIYGENKSSICLSNLGKFDAPDELMSKTTRADFILGPQASTKNTCGIITYGDKVYINFVRTVTEPELERHFYGVLTELGIRPTVESNRPAERNEV